MDRITPDGPVHGFAIQEEWADLRNRNEKPIEKRYRQVVQFVLACMALLVAYIAISNLTSVEVVAPTAAEVMAPDFDLERKLAEVLP